MKICACNPTQGEFSLCGDAWDAPDTEDDIEPFRFAMIGEKVTCKECRRFIALIYNGFTEGGKCRT